MSELADAINALKDTKTGAALDETASLIPRVINIALRRPRTWIVMQENFEKTTLLLEEKMKNIDPDKIIEPPIHVAVPALEALSYSMDSDELRNMYANLLAKAMNSDFTESVQPGFVELIKQLSPLDAIILKNIAGRPAIPYINLLIQLNNGTVPEFAFYTEYSSKLANPKAVTVSISNLIRLGFLEDPIGHFIVDSSQYEPLENSPFILNLCRQGIAIYPTVNSFGFVEMKKERRRLNVTPYGQQFISICLQGD